MKQLDECYTRLREERNPDVFGRDWPSQAGQLDIETVVALKASQALSSEINRPSQADREDSVRIAVEHAGARRGLLLILIRGE